MVAWVIKNLDGLYWQNKDHRWKKTIIAASIYSSEKAAINNYNISFEASNTIYRIGKDCFLKKIIIQES